MQTHFKEAPHRARDLVGFAVFAGLMLAMAALKVAELVHHSVSF